MSAALRFVLIIASCITTGYILKKIHQCRMKIEYSVYWIVLSGIFLVFSIFPQVPTFFSHLMGFQATVNFIFLFIIFALIVKCFLNSVVISRLETQIEELVRRTAVQETIDREKDEEA